MERLHTLPWWALFADTAMQALQRGRERLARAWHQLTLDADERYLRDATDLGDLERRLKRLDRAGHARNL